MFRIIKNSTIAVASLILSGCCIEDNREKLLIAGGVAAGVIAASMITTTKVSAARVGKDCCGDYYIVGAERTRRGISMCSCF